jgi:hypothetical protein
MSCFLAIRVGCSTILGQQTASRLCAAALAARLLRLHLLLRSRARCVEATRQRPRRAQRAAGMNALLPLKQNQNKGGMGRDCPGRESC